jgi:hypothetical protein
MSGPPVNSVLALIAFSQKADILSTGKRKPRKGWYPKVQQDRAAEVFLERLGDLKNHPDEQLRNCPKRDQSSAWTALFAPVGGQNRTPSLVSSACRTPIRALSGLFGPFLIPNPVEHSREATSGIRLPVIARGLSSWPVSLR